MLQVPPADKARDFQLLVSADEEVDTALTRLEGWDDLRTGAGTP
jgi:hypothetical protein